MVTGGLDGLRHEPTARRIRAVLDGVTVLDSTRAVLVWEPRRVVPSYAVPEQDVAAALTPGRAEDRGAEAAGAWMSDVSARPVFDPSVPFLAHTADGAVLDVHGARQDRPGAAFRLADPALPGYVVLDFAAFDGWLEEDEPNVSHPRDPYHRVDVLVSSRHVRMELDGQVLAESTRPTLLFETLLPTRFYLPRADVRVELLPSARRSVCAYKGEATYFSPVVGGRAVPDLAWTYPAPLHDAAHVRDLVCQFDERVDVVLDGERRERPLTPWS